MKRKLRQAKVFESEFSDEEKVSLNDIDEEGNESDDKETYDDDNNNKAELEKKKKIRKVKMMDDKIVEEREKREEEKANIVPYVNKQKVLVFCSRGITARYRHLMEDFRALLPHHRKEVKHDSKKHLFEINGLADLKGCNSVFYFEVKKKKDLYLWATKTPNGPSAKFLVTNVHTMDELQLTGNCLKGSRPILSFGNEFEKTPQLQFVKELFTQMFGSPKGHPKTKPFIDHVFHFSILDHKIWFRCYQITDSTTDKKERARLEKINDPTLTQLVEIGPRMVLTLVKIFDGGFGGRPLYENPYYVSPNKMRSELAKKHGSKYVARKLSQANREEVKREFVPMKDPFAKVFSE